MFCFDGCCKWQLYLGSVLVAVVLISGGFLYLQKRKSEQIMASFKNMLPQHATVLRDGQEKKVNAEDLVLGDIVMLKAGDAVPADLRVLECENLKVKKIILNFYLFLLSRKKTEKKKRKSSDFFVLFVIIIRLDSISPCKKIKMKKWKSSDFFALFICHHYSSGFDFLYCRFSVRWIIHR